MYSPPQKPEAGAYKTGFRVLEPDNSGSKPTNELMPTIPTGDGKRPDKTNYDQQYLEGQLRESTDTISDLSIYSADNDNERRTGPLLPHLDRRAMSRSPAPPSTWSGRWEAFWSRNRGLALVMLSQLFGALMNVTTRLLELDGSHGKGMHPFQVRTAGVEEAVV